MTLTYLAAVNMVVATNHLIDFNDSFTKGGMTATEQQLLAEYYKGASRVFEWGMGSSTLIAAHVNVPKLTAVDSAEIWIEKVKNISNLPYTFHHADIGPLRAFGAPKDFSKKSSWPYYSLIVRAERKPYDIYLVDGRFRVACACQALLHGHKNSIILVHDFKRNYYHVLLNVTDKFNEIGKLIALKRKKSTTVHQLWKLWHAHKFVTQ